MAKISMTIEADSAEDMQDTLCLLSLAGATTYPNRVVMDEVQLPEPEPEPEPDPGATYVETTAEPARRKRRTQAEMAADAALAAADKVVPPTDPFAEQVKRSADEPAAAPATAITKDDMRKAMDAYLTGHTPTQMRDLFRGFKAERLGDVAEADYPAVLAKLTEG